MIRHLLALALVSLTACLAFFALCSIVDAQQPASPRIGVLLVGWSPESKEEQAFRQGLTRHRQSTRHHHPGVDPAACRRGDSVRSYRCPAIETAGPRDWTFLSADS